MQKCWDDKDNVVNLKLPKEYIHLQEIDVLILYLKKENSQPIFNSF